MATGHLPNQEVGAAKAGHASMTTIVQKFHNGVVSFSSMLASSHIEL